MQVVVRPLSLSERMIALAAAISIDYNYFSRHSHGNGLFPMFMPLPIPPYPAGGTIDPNAPDVPGGEAGGAGDAGSSGTDAGADSPGQILYQNTPPPFQRACLWSFCLALPCKGKH